MNRASVRALILILLICAVGAFVKLSFFGVTDSSDYQEYIALARHINGDTEVVIAPWRLLKPLNPLLVAALAHTMSYSTAFIVQALFFYGALSAAVYVLILEFFEDRFISVLAASYVALSYPVLRYGVDQLTETGALFFFVLSLILTVRYIKKPSLSLAVANAAVITIGFLWKEYSVVSGMIFALAVLTCNDTKKNKMMHVLAAAGIFLAVHIPLQIYVYLSHGYTYLAWYEVAVKGAANQHEFTLKNIIKSTAALLGPLWLTVPFGFMRYRSLLPWQKQFWKIGLLPPFIAYAWGYVSSRLLFVIAPPFLIVSLAGMRGWSRTAQTALVCVAILTNIGWLFLSYRIKL